MKVGRLLAILGGLLVLGGVVLGFSGLSVEGVSCGSAFKAARDASVADLGSTLVGGTGAGDLDARCEDRRNDRQALVRLVLIPGVVGLAIGLLIEARRLDDAPQQDRRL